MGVSMIHQSDWIYRSDNQYDLDPFVPLTKRRPKEKPFGNVILGEEIVGYLNNLALYSDRDISLAVFRLSQFNTDPSIFNFHHGAQDVLRYCKATWNC
jgi:hypothetical protein